MVRGIHGTSTIFAVETISRFMGDYVTGIPSWPKKWRGVTPHRTCRYRA
jgi:hypothetical protein